MDFTSRKEEFKHHLEIVGAADGSAKAIDALFNKASRYESDFGIDLCDFNVAQLATLFSEAGWYGYTTFYVYRSFVRKYYQWCTAMGYSMGQNSIDAFSIEDVACPPICYEMYADTDMFLDTLSATYHIADIEQSDEIFLMPQILWCLAWLGFTKKEAVSILKEDVKVEDRMVRSSNGVWEACNVDPRIMDLFQRGIEAVSIPLSVRATNGLFVTLTREYNNTPYLLRTTKRKDSVSDIVVDSTINNWTSKVSDLKKRYMSVLEPAYSKKISYTKIYRNGMYIRLREWEHEYDIADWLNSDQWCDLVRVPQRKAAIFLKSYNLWKSAFYPDE